MFTFQIPITWSAEQHRNLNYVPVGFPDPIQVNLWKEQGHILSSIELGVHKISEPYEWMEYIKDYFTHLNHTSFSVHRTKPGRYIPPHYDLYGYYKKEYGITDLSDIERTIIFLEPWVDGHYLIIGNKIYQNWEPGDAVSWSGDTIHSVINIGAKDRYTLQITGIKIK